jgi:hypothetical protein
MAEDAPIQKITVIVNGTKVVLDPANMKYNENSLSDYMNREYGWIDYLGKQLEFAQKELMLAEIDADAIYSKKFIESKDGGNSDNYAKAYSTSHVDYVEAKKKIVDRKETVGHLKAHLKAWDKNHENSQNRGHSLRAEMKKLNRDIYEQLDSQTCNAEDFR